MARDFAAAMEALGDGDGEGTAEWLELRARAAYGNGAYEEAVTSWERLHTLHRTAGERVPAARAAVMTAMLLLIDAGILSTVRGWVRRAERLLDGEAETSVHALIHAVLAYERFFSGELNEAAPHCAEAIRLGEQFDVMPAIAIGRTAAGRIAVLHGDVDAGLAQLDEVSAQLMSGEVDDLTTGMIFCELICAAQGLLRYDLAREWTDAMHRWGVRGAVGAIRGRCRVHQAELLRLSGPCAAAEREALLACEELRPWLRREYGWPLVELALTRLRRGDLAGAEETFIAAEAHAWPPNPGLALLRLEQGDLESAWVEITAAIAHPVDAPSKEYPPFGDLRMAPLYDALSEISAARADPSAAGEAAEALQRSATRYRSPALAAAAHLAVARLKLMTGDQAAAIIAAGSAVVMYATLEAPYDVARSRVVLADAHEASGNKDAARRERSAARADYARYGADGRVATLDKSSESGLLQRSLTATTHNGTFRRDGPTWIVELGGHAVRIKDRKGLRYLSRMLAEPGREFHVLDLVAVESGTLRSVGTATAGLPVLDDAARDAYRRRLADIDDDAQDAAQMNDLGRLAKAEIDRQYLVEELARAVGLGGRQRRTGESSERARTAVARALRHALDDLATQHRPAAEHLRSSVRTGAYCSYSPDPLAAVDWSP